MLSLSDEIFGVGLLIVLSFPFQVQFNTSGVFPVQLPHQLDHLGNDHENRLPSLRVRLLDVLLKHFVQTPEGHHGAQVLLVFVEKLSIEVLADYFPQTDHEGINIFVLFVIQGLLLGCIGSKVLGSAHEKMLVFSSVFFLSVT